MKRTTAGANYFRICAPLPAKRPTEQFIPESNAVRTAASTLQEIATDNITLRDSQPVQEKWFDIELAENLVEMKTDTQLVVVDIPGINEAGAFNKYKNFVVQKWDTFDCIVVVMDGRQGVNTDRP